MRTRELVAALLPRNQEPRLECTPWWWLPTHTYLLLLYVLVFLVLTALGVDGWMAIAVIGAAATTASQTVRSAVVPSLRATLAVPVRQLTSGTQAVLPLGRWART